METEEIGKIILHAAIEVHSALGPGLLESAYQHCLAYELRENGLDVQTEMTLPIKYKSVDIDAGYRLDMLVAERVIIENKAVEQILPINEAQLLTYLKLKQLYLGYLINWNVPRVKQGIKRIVNGYSERSD